MSGQLPFPAANAPIRNARGVSVQPSAVVTTNDLSSTMSPVAMGAFAPKLAPCSYEIVVDSGDTFQQFLGVGAAMTDTSAYCLMNYLTQAQRTALLTEMYVTNGWSTSRICWGQGGFTSVPEFTYDDVANDTALTNFSIQGDAQRVQPAMQEIMALCPSLKTFTSIWSPPAYMKSGGALSGGSLAAVNATNLTYIANYIVKTIKAYAAIGIPIYAVSVQNEPSINVGSGQSTCTYAAADLLTLIKTYVGPALDAAGLKTRLLAGEDNWDTNRNTFVPTIFGDAAAQAYCDGVAFHTYTGTPVDQAVLMRGYPGKSIHITERRTLTSDTLDASMGIMAADLGVGAVRYGANSITLWNLALNENGGPFVSSASGRRGVVQVSTAGVVTRNIEFYMLSHIGRYVKPGARRCASTSYGVAAAAGTDLMTTAFVNADGSVALFMFNGSASSITATITDATIGYSSPVTIPARAMMTVFYNTTPVSAGSLTPPSAPQSFAASAGSGSVNLSWSAPATIGSTLLGGYRLFRSTTSGAETLLAVLPPGSTSYQDKSTNSGTTYYYTLVAFGGGGFSPATSEVSGAWTAAPPALSGTPSNGSVNSLYYTFTPTTTGGVAPYTYALTGTLPAGLSFSTSTGAISGTPTAAGTTSGLNITVTDNQGATASLGAFSIVVAAATALAQDATATGNSGTSTTSLTFAHTAGANANLLVVGLNLNVGNTSGGADTQYATSVTYGGVALTKLDGAYSSGFVGHDRAAEIWYLLNPPRGAAANVVVNLPQGGALAQGSVSATSVTFNNAQAAPFSTQAKTSVSAAGGATSLSVSTTGTTNGINFGLATVRSTTTLTPGSGETAILNAVNTTNMWGLSFTQPATGSAVTSSASWATADQAALLVVPIKSAA